MRILITNDDGINAPGLKVLSEIADRIAGADGEVWTVAPAFEQSGVGHCISYSRPTMMAELGPRRFALEGSPADCVLVGIHDVMKMAPPELVLSGVNRGNNAGQNTLYSGTIGAAMEAALQGIPAIALSQFYGPGNASLPHPFEAAARHGVRVVTGILAADRDNGAPYRLFYNVNFPPRPGGRSRGDDSRRTGFPTHITLHGGTRHCSQWSPFPLGSGRRAGRGNRSRHRRDRQPRRTDLDNAHARGPDRA